MVTISSVHVASHSTWYILVDLIIIRKHIMNIYKDELEGSKTNIEYLKHSIYPADQQVRKFSIHIIFYADPSLFYILITIVMILMIEIKS